MILFTSMNPELLTLPTEREGVILRQLTIEDAPYYFDSWQHSAEDICRFDPDTRGLYATLEEVQASIIDSSHRRIRMGVWDSDKFVGTTNLRPDEEEGVWLLGYWTDSRETGHGYASLAAKALSRYGADHFTVIRAEVMIENTPSVKILEKIGFTSLGRKVGEFALFEMTR